MHRAPPPVVTKHPHPPTFCGGAQARRQGGGGAQRQRHLLPVQLRKLAESRGGCPVLVCVRMRQERGCRHVEAAATGVGGAVGSLRGGMAGSLGVGAAHGALPWRQAA